MEAKDAFEKMKEDGIARFEGEFGPEARERYGDAAIDGANARFVDYYDSACGKGATEFLANAVSANV